MNQEQYERVCRAINSQQTQGIQIIEGDWGVELDVYDSFTWHSNKGCACALGCLLLEEQPGLAADQEQAAANLLGVDTKAINAFTIGFDGEVLPYTPITRALESEMKWWEAGARMRHDVGLDEGVTKEAA